MKLTNLSLAILVALGVAACGGSDSNDKQTVDPGNGGNGGSTTTTTPTTPPKPDDGPNIVKDPNNMGNLKIEKRFEGIVAASKRVYANRSGEDTLAGYRIPQLPGMEMEYEAGATKTPDILRASSITNYLAAGWVNNSNATNKDAIRLNPLLTYAKGRDNNYYRIASPTGVTWDKATPTNTFTVVSAGSAQFVDPNNIPASNLYFIPNTMTVNTNDESNVGAFIPAAAVLGNITLDQSIKPGINVLNPKAVDYSATSNLNTNVFDTTRGQVAYESVDVNGKSYNIRNSVNGVELDLSSLPMTAEKIQKLPIKFNYSITDNKGTQSGADDDTRQLSTGAGELRVYNLNYSRALVEVNQAAAEDSTSADAAVRNGLGFVGNDLLNAKTNGMVRGYIYGFGNVSGEGSNGAYGPFQVVGYQTPTLPDNGRAHYLGKSFGVNSEGTVQLTADFGLDRAGIEGAIVNRQDGAGNKLDDMVLNNIQLSQPASYRRTASVGMDSTAAGLVNNGVVDLGGTKNWGVWAVEFFGPNAENAGGVIAEGSSQAQITGSNLTNVVEAFNSVRGDINPKSLNNPTNWSK